MYMSLGRRKREDDRRTQGLDKILEGQRMIMVYQPVFSLRELTVIGHEVFSRGPAGSTIEDPERLFALAARTGRLVELERLCRGLALASARRHLAPGRKLFLNLSAGALLDPAVAEDGLLDEVDRQGLDRRDVVLEISERMAVGERQAYQRILRGLKKQGLGIAIDDMGAGYSSLQAMVEL
jgi:EAL domain-containing protein (putative c-di-GMP-specific phosphodiesterase class I)